MLSAIALTPSAPVLVPALAGAATREVAQFGDAALAAARELPDRWIAVGVGGSDGVFGPATRGSFGGYGADVEVTLSRDAPGTVTALPLCALITGWLRGLANPAAQAEVRVYSADYEPGAAFDLGRRLRAEIDRVGEPVGVLVVADGATTLTAAAPGGHDPAAPAMQDALDDALAAGDVAALASVSSVAVGRVAYQVAAGLVEPGPRSATELARGAPYGVGYFVGVWSP